ncbi:hypothetical protein BRAS3843_470062 [Bradyrhizobium sp. STM 3843]|nr:hypothetical protein BRAS3843_470062 [Bradyrhizobium sp. STM 3843]
MRPLPRTSSADRAAGMLRCIYNAYSSIGPAERVLIWINGTKRCHLEDSDDTSERDHIY